MNDSHNFTYSRTRGYSSKTGAAADEEIIAAPGAGKRIAIHDVVFSSSANCNFQVTEGADAAGTRIMDEYYFVAGTTAREKCWTPPYLLPANTALNYTTSAGNSKITVHYTVI